MCYSKDLSLASLSFGIIASLSLIYFGNNQSSSTNKSIGYFFLFVTLMQLVEYFLWIDIDCSNGFNKLDFEALNQGTSGPNTAAFSVYDDSGNLITSNEWNLTTGIKATIVVVREEDKK